MVLGGVVKPEMIYLDNPISDYGHFKHFHAAHDNDVGHAAEDQQGCGDLTLSLIHVHYPCRE